ncbi:pol polyprotein [Tanacetum coccineum]
MHRLCKLWKHGNIQMVDSKSASTRQKMLVQDLQVEFKNYLKHKRKEMSVEHAGSSSRFNFKGNKKDKKKNDKKGKGKSEYLAPKAGIVKQKFQGTCYNCDQPGHRAANCKMPKRVNPRQANMVDENVDMIAMVSDVCAIDTGATRHVCADKSMFHSFRAVDNGQKLYIGILQLLISRANEMLF